MLIYYLVCTEMEKLPICRICLAQNTRMFRVVNKNLRDLYEKLTDVPFVTEDKRPILACFLCCAKLKQCFRFMTKCLEAEELFAQMMNEPNPVTNPDHLVSCSGFITTPIELISIVDTCQTGSIATKEPLPAVCEGLDVVIEPKEVKQENLSDDLELDVDNSYLDEEDMLPDQSEPDSEGDVPLIEIKIEMEEPIEEPEQKHSARVTGKTKLEETITTELKKNEPSNLKVSRTTRNRTSKPSTCYKEPDECDQRIRVKTFECKVCQRSFNEKCNLTRHIQIHTGEKPYTCDICQRGFSKKSCLTRHVRIHTGEKPYTCDICQRSFSKKSSLTRHIRTHTGEKPFKCDVCQRGFIESGALRNHIRIHTSERPFKCDVCQRGFSQTSKLTQHIRIHTADKPFKCGVCPRSFSVKSSLKRHNIRKHAGENSASSSAV